MSNPPQSDQNPHTSPIHFAASSNAFGLTVSPSSSSSSSRDLRHSLSTGTLGSQSFQGTDTSPPSAGTFHTKRLRRPSMLSLTQNASFINNSAGPSGTNGTNGIHRSQVDRDDKASSSLSGAEQDPSSSRNPFEAAPAVQTRTALPLPPPLTGQAEGMISPTERIPNPFHSFGAVQPKPQSRAQSRWGDTTTATPFLSNSLIRRTSSAPPLALEALSTHTPPMGSTAQMQNALMEDTESMETDSNYGDSVDQNEPILSSPTLHSHHWLPPHLQPSSRRKGKAKADDLARDGADPNVHQPPFTGRPLHASLLATLISESSPLEHEMRSEARLQRLLSSHPQVLPLTPRAPRSSRGRFPETAGDDDDEDEPFPHSWSRRSWMGRSRRTSSSDSDTDEGMEELEPEQGEPVNSAFAAGMDMDRPDSRGSSSTGFGFTTRENGSGSGSNSRSDSVGAGVGLPTPPSSQIFQQQQQAPAQSWGGRHGMRMSFSQAGQAASGMVPSPGSGLGLPSAFGGLGMGTGTPLGSPTIERLEVS